METLKTVVFKHGTPEVWCTDMVKKTEVATSSVETYTYPEKSRNKN
jgi:hypothetical protein